MAPLGLRAQAREALELHASGQREEALARAMVLAATNPESALAHNLAGTLHVQAGGKAWDERTAGADYDDDQPPSPLESYHFGAALGAFSVAARLAPTCVLTAVAHAEALNAEQRHADAQMELLRVFSLPTTSHADPALNHIAGFGDSSAKERKNEAVRKASGVLEETTAVINNEIVPREAARLLGGDAVAVDQLRERARRLSETYPYSLRAKLLRVHIELEQVRALDLALHRRPLLRRTLALLSPAAGNFDSSLLIALFHAKVLFALDEFDETERECRRALSIEDPTDPGLDDIPPAISVPGADCDARVASLRRQLRILLKQVVVKAAVCWSSLKGMQQRDSFISSRVDKVIAVRVDTLHHHYDGIDKPAAKTITDAVRFLKAQRSWSFFVCPNSGCDGKKFVNTELLWEHMRSKHRNNELYNKLQSVLGPVQNESASMDDRSLDGITLSQDSEQHDIFNLPRVQDMFESLLLSPSIGSQAEPLVEMRRRKCREGAEILEDIKEKLKMLPQDEISTEFEEFCLAIETLWLKFLETSALDYREVVLPLARSFQWIQMKRSIDLSGKDLSKIIGRANIDIIFGKVPAALDRNIAVEHGSKPSHASNIDHRSGDNLQTENLQPSCSEDTLNDVENSEESEFRIVDSNSETMVDQRSSDPPIDVHESRLNAAARTTDVELKVKGTSDRPVMEMASTSSCQQSLNVLSKNNADKDMSILSLIIRSFCNLGHFRDKFLTEPLAWIPSADNICIAQQFYEIFTSWEKNDQHLADVVLTCMKTLLCRVDCTIFSEKVGTITSEIVATILIGLHMSETCTRFSLNNETEKFAVNPISCGHCICPTHNLFGMKFDAQMSCKCGECSGEYTTLFHKLDARSPQTTKIKSFAELPVLMDEQFCKENSCERCGSPKNIDLFLSNMPHFFTIVLNWLGGSESQDTLSEVLASMTSPLDITFFCKSAHCAAMYTVNSMICYADDRYVCFARDEDKWLICDSETVETEDTWEHLLERFKDCKLQPEVLFFEVIK